MRRPSRRERPTKSSGAVESLATIALRSALYILNRQLPSQIAKRGLGLSEVFSWRKASAANSALKVLDPRR